MSKIIIKPYKFIGQCPAKMNFDSILKFDGMNIVNPPHIPVCALYMFNITSNFWFMHGGHNNAFFVSCPGCIKSLTEENRVVAVLYPEDKPELAAVSCRYYNLADQYGETEAAEKLILESRELERKQKYTEAVRKMESAVLVLQNSSATKSGEG